MNGRIEDPKGAANKSSAGGKGKAPSAAAKVDGTASKAKGAARKPNASGRKRLRPGELDGLVLSQMRKIESFEVPDHPALAAAAALLREAGE